MHLLQILCELFLFACVRYNSIPSMQAESIQSIDIIKGNMYGRRGVHRVLVGKPEGKRPLGRPRRRWEDNIKMELQEMGGGCGDWMELAQGRDRWRALVCAVMNLRVQ